MMKLLVLFWTGFTALASATDSAALFGQVQAVKTLSLQNFQKSIDQAISAPKHVKMKVIAPMILIEAAVTEQVQFNNNDSSTWLWNPNSIAFRPDAMSMPKASDINPLEYTFSLKNQIQFQHLNVSYQRSGLSITSGILTQRDENTTGNKFFLQGSYSLWSLNNFDISVTAKIETLDKNIVKNYYPVENNAANINELSTNKTLGLIGTFAIGDNWKMIGAITTTSVDSKITKSPLIENNNFNMAVIGASYSF